MDKIASHLGFYKNMKKTSIVFWHNLLFGSIYWNLLLGSVTQPLGFNFSFNNMWANETCLVVMLQTCVVTFIHSLGFGRITFKVFENNHQYNKNKYLRLLIPHGRSCVQNSHSHSFSFPFSSYVFLKSREPSIYLLCMELSKPPPFFLKPLKPPPCSCVFNPKSIWNEAPLCFTPSQSKFEGVPISPFLLTPPSCSLHDNKKWIYEVVVPPLSG